MKWLILIPAVMIAYYAYTPLPKDAAEPFKQQIPALTLRIIDDATTIGSLFGFRKEEVARKLTDLLLLTAKYLHPKSKHVETTDTSFDGIAVKIYKPQTQSKEPMPAVVYIHGGGWVLLSADGYDPFTRDLAETSGVMVVSVSYRLAPEHIFPAAFDDCVKATKYFLQNAEKYGVNPNKIGISGDSAGGNLAMAVALYIGKEQIKPSLNFQALLYPALQAMDYNLTSYREFDVAMTNTFTPVTKHTMISYYNMYGFGHRDYVDFFMNNTHVSRDTRSVYRHLVDPSTLQGKYKLQPDDNYPVENTDVSTKIEKLLLNPYFAPLMASNNDFKLLPKTYLMTAEYDGLRDEGMILARRLRHINHPLEYKNWEGIEHGFMIFSFYKSYRDGIQHLSSYINDVSK